MKKLRRLRLHRKIYWVKKFPRGSCFLLNSLLKAKRHTPLIVVSYPATF